MFFSLFIFQNSANANILDYIKEIENSNKQSNEILNKAIINLKSLEQGTVTATVYSGSNEQRNDFSYSVIPQIPSIVISDKITRHVFNLTNQYRPETEMALKVDRDYKTVTTYTYGVYKDQAMNDIIFKLPDVLGTPSTGGGSSTTATIEITKTQEPELTPFDLESFIELTPYMKTFVDLLASYFGYKIDWQDILIILRE